MKVQKYGLFTSISMIIGIVIGSGIFFKSDDILKFTDGSVVLGVFVFILAAISIIFGGLTIAELASRCKEPGGVMSYASQFVGEKIGCGFGWFQTFVYIPTLISVVSWVAGIYTIMLFGWKSTLELQIGIGVAYIFLFFLFNIFSAKGGGYFQNASTVIKLIPLIVIALIGLIFGNVSSVSMNVSEMFSSGTSWIAAIGPIAFAFDGWVISTTISQEVKNAEKNLPIALIVAPIFVLIMYVAYFVGISMLVGPQQIVAMGDAHVDAAASMLFGPYGAKVIVVFVVISVLGTVNGLIIGGCRMPYSLAKRNMLPKSHTMDNMDEKTAMPKNSAVVMLAISLVWMAIHYLTQKFGLLPNSDVSEIAIVTSYMFYIILYIQVIKMGRKGEIKGFFRTVFNPFMAILGALFIFLGGMKNPLFPYFFVFCLIVIVGGIWCYTKLLNKQKRKQ